MCVGFLYRVEVSIPSLSLSPISNPEKVAYYLLDSMVNFIEGLTEFKWSNKCFSVSFLNMQTVSSIYLFHNTGLTGAEFKATSSNNSTYKFGHNCRNRRTHGCSIYLFIKVPVVPKVN